jgi:hypothetical protein
MEQGHGNNDLIAMGQSGSSFLSGIPWWAYVIVMLIGLGLSIFCFVQYSAARRRAAMTALAGSPPPLPGAPPPLPGAPPPLAGSPPPGAGNGFLIGGIAAALLLVLAPLVAMLIMQPWKGDSWIVGRWSERPGCVGDSVEFTRDGALISQLRNGPYRLEGDQLTFDGRTQTVRHDRDSLSIGSETMYRCGGSESAAATPPPFGTPSAPSPSAPSPYAPERAPVPSTTYSDSSMPAPSYASWLIGRWSDSDCRRFMEFRADGTATTANGQPGTFAVTRNGNGFGIVIRSGSQLVDGYIDQNGDSEAILRANGQTLRLRRCY